MKCKPVKRAMGGPAGMPSQATKGKGLAKMPPGIARRMEAGKSVPAGIARTRASLLPQTTAMKNGGKVKKMAIGGMALPSQAASQAGQAMAARPAMPAQAVGARPFKKGGSADKAGRAMTKKGLDARGRAMKGK